MQNDKLKFKKEFVKRLVNFSIKILRFVDVLKKDKISWSVLDQLVRSATSVGANVVEARASSSKKDYIKFFEIALKSANETLYWLILLREITSNKEIEEIYRKAEELSKILASSILTLKGKR
jgi:four helix bundle protein